MSKRTEATDAWNRAKEFIRETERGDGRSHGMARAYEGAALVSRAEQLSRDAKEEEESARWSVTTVPAGMPAPIVKK